MSTRGQVYFDRNFLHFQSADIRGLTARPHATPGLFRGQPRSKSRTPERHMRFAVRRRGQVKPYLTDRGQPRSTAVTSRSSEIHGFCLQESMNVVRSLPLVSPASQHACIMEAASRHHRSSRCLFSRIEKCHARVLSTFRASIQSSWNHWPAVSRNSHG